MSGCQWKRPAASGSVLVISRWETNEPLLCARMREGETFLIGFTHSVNRRPVYDTIRTEKDHLVIVGSRFDAFGAGMPEATTLDGTLKVEADGWLVWTVNRPVPEIVVRVGRVAGHFVNLKDRTIPLTDIAEPGSALAFRICSATPLDPMKGRCIP